MSTLVMNDAHVQEIPAVLRQLKTSESGLSLAEAQERLGQYGPNALQGKKQKSRLQVFLAQFKDLMVLLLVIAAAVSFISGEQVDAIVILAIIFGNAAIGF